MIKIAGIALISISVSIFGLILSDDIKKKIKLRQNAIQLIKYIQNEIKHTPLCLDEIFSAYCSSKDFTLCTAYKNGFDNASLLFALKDFDEQSQKALYAFFSRLGKSKSHTEELEKCCHVLSALDEICKENDTADKNRAYLYKKLSLVAAICTAIILL